MQTAFGLLGMQLLPGSSACQPTLEIIDLPAHSPVSQFLKRDDGERERYRYTSLSVSIFISSSISISAHTYPIGSVSGEQTCLLANSDPVKLVLWEGRGKRWLGNVFRE